MLEHLLLLFSPIRATVLDREAQVAEDHSFLMLAPFKGEVRRPRKALAAGLVMLGTVLGATVSQVGLGPAALTGATALVLTRCLTPRQAYRAIDVRMFVSWPAPSRSARRRRTPAPPSCWRADCARRWPAGTSG